MEQQLREVLAGASVGAVVVVAAPDRRAAAASLAAQTDERVVDVDGAATPGTPWGGLGLLAGALRAVVPAAVPPAIDAAAAGAATGDHLGLGADLHSLLAAVAETSAVRLVVNDAHLLDRSSAAALSHALGAPPPGLQAVVTQGDGCRGVTGLPTIRLAPEVDAAPDVGIAADPDALVTAGALHDAADVAEREGDWVTAARRWLLAGRPDRCRSCLARAGEDPRSAEVRARLAQATERGSVRRAAIRDAAARLDAAHPLDAVRLRLLEAVAQVGAGDPDAALDAVAECRRPLARSRGEGDRAALVVGDLVDLVSATAEAARSGSTTSLLDAVERPLARLGEGGVDVDAVRLLTTAAMPLAWGGRLPEARTLLDRVTGVLHARRRFLPLPHPLATSAWLARRRARLEVALADGTRAVELGRAAGADNDVRFAISEIAHVEAMHGRLEDCRRHVAELVPEGTVPRGPAQLGAVAALASGELLADHPERAVALLEPVQERFGDQLPPSHTAWRHNLVEGYVRTGQMARARVVLDDLERWSARRGTDRELGQVAWCQGMLAPPGQHDEHFRRARRLLQPYPAVRWRAELHHLRRLLAEGRRSEAMTLADRLSAEARAAGVLAGIDQLRRVQEEHGIEVTDEPPRTNALTVDELRVALAVVEGADDDEIAQRLQLTPRTVADLRARISAVLGGGTGIRLSDVLRVESAEPGVAVARVGILGPVVVQRGDRRSAPPSGRPATLLGLVAAERSVPVDRALDVLWPDTDPERARARLRNVLARLRAAVGPLVEREGELLVLGRGVVVDAQRFLELSQRALDAGPGDLESLTDDALSLWAGEPLPAWPYEDWAMQARDHLVQRCVSVLERRAEHRAGAGDVDGALDDLERALLLRPDAEELWGRAIAIAEADGRTGRARSLHRRAGGLHVRG